VKLVLRRRRPSCDNGDSAIFQIIRVRKFLPTILLSVILGLLLPSEFLHADELDIVIRGIDEPMLGNVRILVEPFRFSGSSRLSRRRREELRLNSVDNARLALRPFGHYHPVINSRFTEQAERSWLLELSIDPGPPVLISEVEVDVRGPGAVVPELQKWKSEWPLLEGDTLVQPKWDEQKQRILEIAADEGYLLASFSSHSMEVDLEKNQARLGLILETGEQAVMGQVTFTQDIVYPHVLENLPRFEAGDPYNAWIMERFRIDVWRTGYYRNIEIIEERRLEESPPRVNLNVSLKPRNRNTYQGTIGVGSDTGPRIQFSWNRHLISPNGDSFSLGTGWQEHNNEFFVRGGYRFPRNVDTRQFWVADALLKRENEDINVTEEAGDEQVYMLGNADISDYSLRLGRMKVRDRRQGFLQLFETMYVEYLNETIDARINPIELQDSIAPPEENIDLNPLARTSNSLSFGIEYDMPYVRGQGFETTGMHHRAWAFTSNESWGSDIDFSQIYFSSRWNIKKGNRWKFLLRGEVGYTDARVEDAVVEIEETLVSLSVTELPNIYRFKAGGSSSVRGYAFERLSTNNIGSNNVFTASAEVEMRILQNWSVAAFLDVGNAFNDWDHMDLKKGIGMGIRWYTIAGAVRVDFAQALDLPDKPWRIHFTIGTSLL
jgi:translocation and assembly module TamA